MSTDQKDIDRLRGNLEEKLRRVPDWVNGASVQAVRDYKKNYLAAKKLVAKSKATHSELQSAINSVS